MFADNLRTFRVRPLIYHVFRWSWPQDIFHAVSRPTPTFRPEEGNGPFVKHLFLRHTSYSHHIESMKKVIQHCPNTQDMAVWCGADNLPKLYPIFSYLTHLKRFSGCFEDLSREQMLSPVFQGLTHLQINSEVPLDVLIELKALTHLRSCIPEGPYEHSRKAFLSRVCSDDGCPWLQVIKVFAKHAELVHDVRIVIMPSWMQIFMIADADWLAGANGRLDSWKFASRIVHARKSEQLGLSSIFALILTKRYRWLHGIRPE